MSDRIKLFIIIIAMSIMSVFLIVTNKDNEYYKTVQERKEAACQYVGEPADCWIGETEGE